MARARGQRSALSPLPGATAVRSLVLGAAVFTCTTITGALLAGATPAEGGPARTEPVAAVLSSDRAVPVSPAVDPHDPLFAYSMIATGAGALVISVAGAVMVARRRSHW